MPSNSRPLEIIVETINSRPLEITPASGRVAKGRHAVIDLSTENNEKLIPASRSPVDVLEVLPASISYDKTRVALNTRITVTFTSSANIAITPADFAGDIGLDGASATNVNAYTVRYTVLQSTLVSEAAPLTKLRWSTSFGSSSITAPSGVVINLRPGSFVQTAEFDASYRYVAALVNYDADASGAYPAFSASDLVSSWSGAGDPPVHVAPALSGYSYAVTFKAATASPMTFTLSWNTAAILASGNVFSFSPQVVILQLECPSISALGATIRCFIYSTPESAPFNLTHIQAPRVQSPATGSFGSYEAVIPNKYSFTYYKTDRTSPTSAIKVSFSESYIQTYQTDIPRGVLAASTSINYVDSAISCSKLRIHALGGSTECFIQKVNGADFTGTDIFNVTIGDPRVTMSAITLVDGSTVSFTITALSDAATGTVSISANYMNMAGDLNNVYIGGSPLTITLVRAELACDRTRVALSRSVSCNLTATAGSSALELTDFSSSATFPGGTATISSALTFTAAPSTGSPSTIAVGFATGGPSLTFDVDVVEVQTISCANTRLLPGCQTVCTVAKAAGSPDLLVTDVDLVAPPLGTSQNLATAAGGALEFVYEAVLGNGDTGVSLGIAYGSSIDGSSVSTTGKSITVKSISTLGTLQCGQTSFDKYSDFKLLYDTTYTCALSPINGSAALQASDLQLSSNGSSTTFASTASDGSGGLTFTAKPTQGGAATWSIGLGSCGVVEQKTIQYLTKPVLSCPEVTALGAKIGCTLDGRSTSPDFLASWVTPLAIDAPAAGTLTPFSLVSPGLYAFNFTNTNGTNSVTFRTEFEQSIIKTSKSSTDVNGTVTTTSQSISIGSTTVLYVAASMECRKTTILSGAWGRCYLNATGNSAPFPRADIFSVTSSNSSRVSIGSRTLVDGTNGAAVQFDVIADARAPVSTVSVSASFADLGGFNVGSVTIAGSPVSVSVDRNLVNATISCAGSRMNGDGGRVLCTINKTDNSVPFPSSNIFALTSSVPSKVTFGAISLINSGTTAQFEAIAVGGSAPGTVSITAEFTNLEEHVLKASNIGGVATVTLLRATVTCTPARAVVTNNITCSVAPTGGSAALTDADFTASAAFAGGSAEISGLAFWKVPALGNQTAEVSWASGGGKLTTHVVIIAPTSPALLATDVTLGAVTHGSVTSVAASSGDLTFTYTGGLNGGDAGQNLTFAWVNTNGVLGNAIGASTAGMYKTVQTISAMLICGLPPAASFKLLTNRQSTCTHANIFVPIANDDRIAVGSASLVSGMAGSQVSPNLEPA
eukprot:tig00020824_g14228.t1